MAGFGAAVNRALSLLEHRGRVSQRALKLELGLDDETFEVLRDELVEVLGAADDVGGVLVYRGSAAPSEQIERRLVTVLMCDLVASTSLSRRLDPEDLSAVMRRYTQICNDVIARHDGHISSWIGDGVVVLFGYPHATEDDAIRAVRCGHELAQAIVAAQDAVNADHGSCSPSGSGSIPAGPWSADSRPTRAAAR